MFANVVYLVAITLASPIIAFRMIRHGRYRRGFAQKFFGLSRQDATKMASGKPCIWIHAVSVGEVNLLPGIVRKLHQREPDVVVVISSSTDTGYDLAVKRFGSSCVFFAPLDFSWAVRRTIRNLKPSRLVLAELELWPNLISNAKRNDCRVIVINARLSRRSAEGYQRFSFLMESTFRRLDWVGCQDEETRIRFAHLKTPVENLAVTGSLKFDNAPSSRDTPGVQRLTQWSGVDPWHRVWIAGSTQRGEEAMAIRIYQKLIVDHPELRLVLVPRHQERFDEVARSIGEAGLVAHRRSTSASMFDRQWTADTVILVDTIGELRDWWGVGPIATVGGSFGDRGGQNMLEPAGYGSAVSFGPDTRNFEQIAGQLIDAGGAVRVKDDDELEAFVRRCLDDIPAADSLGSVAQSVVRLHRGATTRTIDGIFAKVIADAIGKAA